MWGPAQRIEQIRGGLAVCARRRAPHQFFGISRHVDRTLSQDR